MINNSNLLNRNLLLVVVVVVSVRSTILNYEFKWTVFEPPPEGDREPPFQVVKLDPVVYLVIYCDSPVIYSSLFIL